ncbi:MAG: O-antigen ligase family protein [Myxococcales bacterium]
MDRRTAAYLLAYAGLGTHAFFVPISIAGMQIALAVAAAGLLVDWGTRSRLRRAPCPRHGTPLDWPILAFAALAVLSDLITPEGAPPLISATLWRAAIGFFVVFHASRLVSPMKILGFICAGLALSSIVGLIQYRTGVDLVYLLHLRVEAALVEAPGVPDRFGAMGFFTSRLTFGHNATVLSTFLVGALAAGAIPRSRVWMVAGAAVLGLAAVAVTFDRAAWLGVGAASGVVALLSAPRVRMALLPALGVIVLLGAFHGGIRDRFTSSFSAAANSDRVFIWSTATQIIRDHPFTGIGFANYPRVGSRYYDRLDPSFGMRTWAHNLELSTLAEMGPLGLLALLWLFAAAARALVRRRSALAVGGLAALVALFVIGQAHDVLYDTKVMYALWLALGLSLAPSPELRPATIA